MFERMAEHDLEYETTLVTLIDKALSFRPTTVSTPVRTREVDNVLDGADSLARAHKHSVNSKYTDPQFGRPTHESDSVVRPEQKKTAAIRYPLRVEFRLELVWGHLSNQ